MTPRRLIDRWQRYWFAPSDGTDLGVARALFYAGVLLMYAPYSVAGWGDVDRGFWTPIPLFARTSIGPTSATTLGLINAAWQIALLLSAVGLFGRISMAIAAVLGIYVLGLPHNFGQTFHFDALLVLVMIVLACSRATDVWSLDAVMASRRGGRAGPDVSGEYTWPIKLVWVLMASVFVSAGLSKLRHSGLEWILTPHLSLLLIKAMYHVSDADPLTAAGLWIARHEWMATVLAAIAVATELGFAAAPFSRRARAVLVPGGILLLGGIRVLMGPTFGGFLIANVFWIPWRHVAARARSVVYSRRRAQLADESGTTSLPV
jgi:hypothetical protein